LMRPVAVLLDWPSLSDIENKVDGDLSNVSVSALLIPSYANHTDQGYVLFCLFIY
jgi:hypothetical protein